MVQGDVDEKHRAFNSRTDVDGQAIVSIRHQVGPAARDNPASHCGGPEFLSECR